LRRPGGLVKGTQIENRADMIISTDEGLRAKADTLTNISGVAADIPETTLVGRWVRAWQTFQPLIERTEANVTGDDLLHAPSPQIALMSSAGQWNDTPIRMLERPCATRALEKGSGKAGSGPVCTITPLGQKPAPAMVAKWLRCARTRPSTGWKTAWIAHDGHDAKDHFLPERIIPTLFFRKRLQRASGAFRSPGQW
tara:strand:+ start:293 stop:883 length:591 start_codon:yes stop_codon:yes gene_type:complete